MYSTIVRALPPIRYEFLIYFVKFMADVALHSEDNKMDSTNVAKIFSTLILGNIENDMKKNKQVSDPKLLFMETNEIAVITKLFVEEYDKIFSGDPCPPRIYRVIEDFCPTSKAYMKVEKDDIVVYLSATDSGAIIAVDQNVGEIPNSTFDFNMRPTKLSNLHVSDVSGVLYRKIEKMENAKKKP